MFTVSGGFLDDSKQPLVESVSIDPTAISSAMHKKASIDSLERRCSSNRQTVISRLSLMGLPRYPAKSAENWPDTPYNGAANLCRPYSMLLAIQRF